MPLRVAARLGTGRKDDDDDHDDGFIRDNLAPATLTPGDLLNPDAILNPKVSPRNFTCKPPRCAPLTGNNVSALPPLKIGPRSNNLPAPVSAPAPPIGAATLAPSPPPMLKPPPGIHSPSTPLPPPPGMIASSSAAQPPPDSSAASADAENPAAAGSSSQPQHPGFAANQPASAPSATPRKSLFGSRDNVAATAPDRADRVGASVRPHIDALYRDRLKRAEKDHLTRRQTTGDLLAGLPKETPRSLARSTDTTGGASSPQLRPSMSTLTPAALLPTEAARPGFMRGGGGGSSSGAGSSSSPAPRTSLVARQMTRLATRGSFLTPADESLIRSQVAKAGVLAARRGADFHDQTWTASVDIAHAQQEGAEQAFKNQVDMLMQVPRVQAAFRKMDADGDGVMTSEEISNGIVVCMEEMGVSATPKQLEKLLRKLDEDHDGVFDGNLSLAKLCTILVGRHDEVRVPQARRGRAASCACGHACIRPCVHAMRPCMRSCVQAPIGDARVPPTTLLLRTP